MTIPLQYAPSAFERRPTLLVILAGLFTTVVALVGMHFIQPYVTWEILSVTVDWIPVGAIGVGLVAGSGYSIAARLLNVRMRTSMVLLIVLLQVCAYFAGSYVEFRAKGPLYHSGTNQPVSFSEYYRLQTTAMRWESYGPSYGPPPPQIPQGPWSINQAPPPAPEGIGAWGYAVRLLEVAGFTLGCVIMPMVQRSKAYCDPCQRYMKSRTLAKMPGCAPLPSFRLKNSFDMNSPENRDVLAAANAAMQETILALQAGNIEAVRNCEARYGNGIKGTVPLIATVKLTYCPQCKAGKYSAALTAVGNFRSVLAGERAKGDLPPQTIANVIGA